MSRWSEEGGGVTLGLFLPSLLYTHWLPALPALGLHCFLTDQCGADCLYPGPDDQHHLRSVSSSAQRDQRDEYCPAAPAEWRHGEVRWGTATPLLSSQCWITWLATPLTSPLSQLSPLTSHTLTLQHLLPEPEVFWVTQFNRLSSVHCQSTCYISIFIFTMI